MNQNQINAYKILEQAQQALKRGEKHLARQYAEQAARLAPDLEEPWLMMAAVATPRGSVAFLERALQINPGSDRASKGMLWARERLRKQPPRQAPSIEETTPTAVKPAALTAPSRPAQQARPVEVAAPATARPPQKVMPAAATVPVAARQQEAKTAPARVKKPAAPSRSLYIALLVILCVVAAGIIATGVKPVAAFLNRFPGQQDGPAWAQVELPKPTYTETSTPTDTASPTFTFTPTFTSTLTFTPTLTFSPTSTQTSTSTITSTSTQTDTPTLAPTGSSSPTPLPPELAALASPTPLPTDTAIPGPTQYVPTPLANIAGAGVRWIDVDLTHQMVYAYEGQTIVNSFVVSTGTWQYPTVTGQYRVYIKYRYKDMTGPGYYLPDVPYTMFFYQGYAIHGTYWHNNFGTPMSHGCVNLTIPDAEWVYNFASVGTLVNVHY